MLEAPDGLYVVPQWLPKHNRYNSTSVHAQTLKLWQDSEAYTEAQLKSTN